jgi:hypothetical protein
MVTEGWAIELSKKIKVKERRPVKLTQNRRANKSMIMLRKNICQGINIAIKSSNILFL